MPAHLQLVLPAAVLHAVDPFLLLRRAVLESRPGDCGLALLVPLQHGHQLIVIGRRLFLDLC